MSKVGEGMKAIKRVCRRRSAPLRMPRIRDFRPDVSRQCISSRALVQPRDVTDGAGCRAGDRGGARCWPSENRAAAELEKLTRNDLGAAFWRGDRAVTGSPAAASARRT
ncbi:uncharacterized protein LOC115337543 isoform X3 [Aquila chrysaetos chrysaetos]|uniref:uncharacterized protein LOC115337543 isoform X3 n=1 Tax=Aquila chrysaetos chrysaetos TaxID=223781 RepID=UPI001176E7A9|nr:uncharacterized protein LOC115337543 isoform X3 [Aquila chrysaetos chrysaetos]